jgi:predicted CXXCH cytochrome family protein
MLPNHNKLLFFGVAWALVATASLELTSSAQESVLESRHNLSANGPGMVRAESEGRVCVFCHAPHSAERASALWNRDAEVKTYRIYSSSTLDAAPGQPTGASKMCLSCHDGTVALGSVRSRSDRITMNTGDRLPPGSTNLGVDLSDDHPISFAYTSGLALSDGRLRARWELPADVRLDANGDVQCTSCHDPHDNSRGHFLVRTTERGDLCISCHQLDGWELSAHARSTRPVWDATRLGLAGKNVMDSACDSCHQAHSAGGHEWLMRSDDEEENCLVCHDGRVARTDLRSELSKYSAHDASRYRGLHQPGEQLGGEREHVECSDCHDPHSVSGDAVVRARGLGSARAPIGQTLLGVPGVGVGGAPVAEARYEYEVCFRCHGDASRDLGVERRRQADSGSLRLEFAPFAASAHPVVNPSDSPESPSLVPALERGSMIRCTDCHNNDAGPAVGGRGPDGPHGSRFAHLLERRYTTRDFTTESAIEYDLCYKCHERASILGDESFRTHKLHVVDNKTACSACHDPHGVDATRAGGSDHTHLINFDLVVVEPEATTGRLEFEDRGRFAGSCTLACHGAQHLDLEYR